MRWGPLAAVAMCLAFCGNAKAVVFVTPLGQTRPQPYQRIADRALVPTVPGPLALHTGNCPGAGDAEGCQYPGAIWLQPDLGPSLEWIELHELGHTFDAQLLGAAGRAAFLRLTDDPRGWEEAGGRYEAPVERFAQAYAECAFEPVRPWSERQPGISYRNERRVCSLIRRVFARAASTSLPLPTGGGS